MAVDPVKSIRVHLQVVYAVLEHIAGLETTASVPVQTCGNRPFAAVIR